MKPLSTFYKAISLIALISLFAISSCLDPADPCQLQNFFWEGQYYDLYYNSSGRLELMESPDSHIDLFYDELDRLIKADHYLPGAVTPSYEFFFSHGPFGITEIDEYHGSEHNKRLFGYTASGDVDHTIWQEFCAGPTVCFEITSFLTFTGDNLTFVNSTSTVINTEYTIDQYDKAKNPFKMLAEAVGNPKFFPLGFFVSFPVSNFDISFGNRFSRNNPHYAEYVIPGSGLDPQIQEFIYGYVGVYPTSLRWTDSSYGTTMSEEYAFTYFCP